MIDFGLKPCPLCGCEPTVEHLTQRPEQLRAVIKCSRCGLTLDWETEISVGVSRSGKRTPVKVGLDPIEAWNQRQPNCDACTYCKDCSTRSYANQVVNLPNCNDCGRENCEYKPNPGEHARINCPLWRPMEAKE
jgi:hypothetical protein